MPITQLMKTCDLDHDLNLKVSFLDFGDAKAKDKHSLALYLFSTCMYLNEDTCTMMK